MTRSLPVNRTMPKLKRDMYRSAGARRARCTMSGDFTKASCLKSSACVLLTMSVTPRQIVFPPQGRTRIINHKGYGE